ncbi:peptidoglycan-binding protein LysM [Flavobacterium sp. Fl-77]|uniref:Peptidoglycan-binding protein LysM n=1 Tax=Flavobacterium flavipigmentatum TaxID=2893884 RepID=A0AAJ2VZS3_9FLAO|nr:MULTISPECIES: peptidoglycan-binding protein LysM [unclassified Flavobacterium]MDX6184048.1 peptidoglycan-binding protein LysM [Flavobacterium sp. Fl-33]MDX6187634.1 peptidoglycan-binding protein LysM [Flavobacterium sp. Fl-77]UFH39224.1 peptidoglycan-binding protein LysM [Flavobacterium sp. F-70]
MYYINESELLSSDKHRTYKIRKGDTLESVARDLGVAAQELRRYHNIYCAIPDLIEADFKSHLEFLILAPEKKEDSVDEIVEKKPRKVIFGKDYKLPFLPEGIKKEYKVQYTTEVGQEIDTIEMEVSLKWLATDKNKFHLFEINRKSIFINNKMPDTVMEELGVKTAAVLYPLKIVVDGSGKWVDIYNYDDIVYRWKDTKREILDYYEGEVVKAYIKETEFALDNSERLFTSLRSDYFLRTFFNGINVGYTADYGFQKDFLFPLEEETESVFSVENKISPNLDGAGLIKIEQKGDYVDSGFGFMYDYAPSKVNYNAVYFLNSDTYVVEKMNLECNIDNIEPKKLTIVIELFKNNKEKKIVEN